jgi:hypothetical protein
MKAFRDRRFWIWLEDSIDGGLKSMHMNSDYDG